LFLTPSVKLYVVFVPSPAFEAGNVISPELLMVVPAGKLPAVVIAHSVAVPELANCKVTVGSNRVSCDVVFVVMSG
jgi:hypothetical protein